jgi:hypothetical protein
MNKIFLLFFILLMISCKGKVDRGTTTKENLDPRTTNFPKKVDYVVDLPKKENFWIFVLAGQSNMAGRGFVEPEDTVPSSRIYTIDKGNRWIIAKEPLHFYEPSIAGLDCGLSFGKELLAHLSDSIYIGLIPCAVGGSPIEKWVGDSLHRGVKLFSNFKNKVEFASKVGTIKGIIWHQGEDNASRRLFVNYSNNLQELFFRFRKIAQNDSLPILVGELGSFLHKQRPNKYTDSINIVLKEISDHNKDVILIKTDDLNHKGDFVHFDSKSQRLLGKRFAEKLKIK